MRGTYFDVFSIFFPEQVLDKTMILNSPVVPAHEPGRRLFEAIDADLPVVD